MGQAKLRGTYEQRSAQAEQRAAEERAERDRKEAEAAAAAAQAEAERVAAMTPEERERYSNRKHRRHMETAMVMGLLMSPFLSSSPRRRNK